MKAKTLKMKENENDKAKHRRASLQLQRLARMIDVVYAIIIWRFFILLPRPTSEQYARRLRDRILAEPITAIITIPLAFVGPIFWEISWLIYPLVVFLVRGRRRAKMN
jgi:hypothetical protein